MNAETFEFKPAVREETSLLIAIAGASGSGKTFSALLMAKGLCGGNPGSSDIALIDTEARRALHYADQFTFRHLDFPPPFTPERTIGSIHAAEKSGAKVIIIDSASDEYEGVGGLQQMHDDEVARLASGRGEKKSFDQLEGWIQDKYSAPAWRVPKVRHKTKLIAPLRQIRAYVIFCLRADEKIRFVKYTDDRGREKTGIENAGWVPICEKRFAYDMTMMFTVTPDNPGVPMIRDGKAVFGKINEQHLYLFPEGKRISVETGLGLREWATGGKPAKPNAQTEQNVQNEQPTSTDVAADGSVLSRYHMRLRGEVFRADLEEAHAQFKPNFDGADNETLKTARHILNLHTDRVEGRLNADQVDDLVRKKL